MDCEQFVPNPEWDDIVDREGLVCGLLEGYHKVVVPARHMGGERGDEIRYVISSTKVLYKGALDFYWDVAEFNPVEVSHHLVSHVFRSWLPGGRPWVDPNS